MHLAFNEHSNLFKELQRWQFFNMKPSITDLQNVIITLFLKKLSCLTNVNSEITE